MDKKGQVQLHKFSKNADQKLGKRAENARMWAEVITKRSNPIAHAWNSERSDVPARCTQTMRSLRHLSFAGKKARFNITRVCDSYLEGQPARLSYNRQAHTAATSSETMLRSVFSRYHERGRRFSLMNASWRRLTKEGCLSARVFCTLREPSKRGS